jgi:hypothetical protein
MMSVTLCPIDTDDHEARLPLVFRRKWTWRRAILFIAGASIGMWLAGFLIGATVLFGVSPALAMTGILILALIAAVRAIQ